MKSADNVSGQSNDMETEHGSKVSKMKGLLNLGQELAGQADRRVLWLEMLTVQNLALPRPKNRRIDLIVPLKRYPLEDREELYIRSIETQHFADLKTWFTKTAQTKYENGLDTVATIKAGGNAAPADPKGKKKAKKKVQGPKGPGWVIELDGYHDFNKAMKSQGTIYGSYYVHKTLIANLEEMQVKLPGYDKPFTMKELGFTHPILTFDSGRPKKEKVSLSGTSAGNSGGGGGAMGGGGGGAMGGAAMGGAAMGGAGGGGAGAGGGTQGAGGATQGGGGAQGAGNFSSGGQKGKKKGVAQKKEIFVVRYYFTVQYCWQPKRLAERIKARIEADKKKAKKKATTVAAR